jgi:hypothetical protein
LVVTLQTLVLNDYATVDDFLSDNAVSVTVDFATLSAACGFPISADNVNLDS